MGKWVEDIDFSPKADGKIINVIMPDPGGMPNIPYDEANTTDVLMPGICIYHITYYIIYCTLYIVFMIQHIALLHSILNNYPIVFMIQYTGIATIINLRELFVIQHIALIACNEGILPKLSF